MTIDRKKSDFDLDMARGVTGELFADDIRRMLGDKSATVEVKTDSWFVHTQRFYVERECQGRDGVWRRSGIDVTKARLWTIVWGRHPALLTIETAWLQRAMELAAKDERNRHAKCDKAGNPTRGVYVYLGHLLKTRDPAMDDYTRPSVIAAE